MQGSCSFISSGKLGINRLGKVGLRNWELGIGKLAIGKLTELLDAPGKKFVS
jgi:hypothetical protein